MFSLLISCVNSDNILEYYDDGNVKIKLIKVSDKVSEVTEYYKNGRIKETSKYFNNVIHGLALEYYDTGELYSDRIFDNGTMNGRTTFYYQDGSVKAENLFKNDSLFYVKSITSGKDTFDKIIPIVKIKPKKEFSDIFEFNFEIPRSDEFPYKGDVINIHYSYYPISNKSIKPLPSKKIVLNSKDTSVNFEIFKSKTEDYKLIGMITLNEDPLIIDNDHYFEFIF